MLNSLRGKLLAAFAVVIAIFLVLGASTAVNLLGIQDAAGDQVTRVRDENTALQFKNTIGMLYSNQADLIINDNPEMLAEYRENQKEFESLLTAITKAADTGEEAVWAKELIESANAYTAVFGEVAKAFETRAGRSLAEQKALNKQLDDRTDVAKNRMFELTDKLVASYRAEFKLANAVMDQKIQFSLMALLGFTLFAVAAGVTIALFIARQLSTAIAELAAVAEGIAAGRLDQRIKVRSNDELGRMATSFQMMIGQLRTVITQVRGASDTVAGRSGEIAAATEQMGPLTGAHAATVHETGATREEMAASIQQVAGNAQALAGNVEETSASIEEMAASIQQVAGTAGALSTMVDATSASITQVAGSIHQVASHIDEVAQVTAKTATIAEDGRKAVEQTIGGMADVEAVMTRFLVTIQGLEKSSAEIGAIVQLIDDIAQQTNLLALNASIEAARAGEHGRGFAVVANEVKALAHRSATAAQEIGSLIQGVQSEMAQAAADTQEGNQATQAGARLARQAGGSLVAIVESVGQVGRLVNQVTQATREQVSAANQITGSVEDMRAMTLQVATACQQQAVSSNQIIAATEQMNRMTQQVSMATGEQRKGGNQVMDAMAHLEGAAREVVGATDQIAGTAADLQRLSLNLQEAIGFFQLGEGAGATTPAPGALTATVASR
ncbi:MAG: methyl-accepting chemotaxis protein [Candidatus Sericytochromatia bacterium]